MIFRKRTSFYIEGIERNVFGNMIVKIVVTNFEKGKIKKRKENLSVGDNLEITNIMEIDLHGFEPETV